MSSSSSSSSSFSSTSASAAAAAAAAASGQNSNSIQILLEAEKRASNVVNAARRYRETRKGDAERDAHQEIECYRRQAEKQTEVSVLADTGECEMRKQRVDSETAARLAAIVFAHTAAHEKAVQRLVNVVTSANPVLHPNAQHFGAVAPGVKL